MSADKYRSIASAYPVEVFTPLNDAETKIHSNIVTRASAAMGRHFAKLFNEAADEIEALEAEIERLQSAKADKP
jgi:hypothetical protein